MKPIIVLCFLSFAIFGCGNTVTLTRLQTDQKLFRDSANNIKDRIGGYMRKGMYDSVAVQNKHLSAVYQRLTEIQLAIDRHQEK